MGAGTNSGKGAGYGNRMPGPASIAGNYRDPTYFQPNGQKIPDPTGALAAARREAMMRANPEAMLMGGGGPTLSTSSGGVGSYNPTGQRSDLASVLAGSPTMVGTSGMQMGGGFQKPGKPSISTAGGGGKPSIGMGGPSRAMWK